jgi:RNA polymerase sigma factor (sigma-70 family)
VAQNVAIRICRTLATVDVPSEQDLVRLASQHILWELQSLHARHTGPQGFAGNHATDPAPKDGVPPRHAAAASREASPHGVAFYQELQTLVGSLPEEERVVFDRLHFLGWTHQEVADDLGLSVETTKRRFRRAKLRLAERLGPDG